MDAVQKLWAEGGGCTNTRGMRVSVGAGRSAVLMLRLHNVPLIVVLRRPWVPSLSLAGTSRFTRGLSACILRAVPANAVLLTTAFRVKEVGYAYFNVNQHHK